LCFTETWLSDSFYNNEIFPSGFSVYRKDRSSKGGGVMMAVRDSISVSFSPSPNELEVVSVVVSTPQPVTVLSIFHRMLLLSTISLYIDILLILLGLLTK